MALADTANEAGKIGAIASYYAPILMATALPFAKKLFNFATADFQKLMTEQNELLKRLLADYPPKKE
jgi:hypothetical protein